MKANDVKWIGNVERLKELIQDGYRVQIAGLDGDLGWWVIKPTNFQTVESYRVVDEVVEELKLEGYKEVERGVSCYLEKI